MTASSESVYLNALTRLKEKNEPISLNKVAIEAGKKSGSLRPARYPDVCEEVQKAIDGQKASKKSKTQKNKDRDERYDNLKQSYESNRTSYHIALTKIINLENQLFEMAKELEAWKEGQKNAI